MLTEPLVMLPGMMCDARLFGPQVAAFAGERPVAVPPLPEATIAENAAAVLEPAPERFSLLGLSMGGIVAMEVMRQAGHRVTRLALFDTNPLAEAPEVASGREPQIAAAEAGRLEAVMRDEMKPRYLAPGPRQGEVLDRVMEMALDLGPEVFVRQSRALQRRADARDVLKRVTVPTLVACGEHDTLCPVARHEMMAELIPGARLSVIPGAGHLPPLERPNAVIGLLRDWLGSGQSS